MRFFSRRDKDGYGKDGYGKDGFDVDAVHHGEIFSDLVPRYRKYVFDKTEFNEDGSHKVTGTKFNEDGFDKDGIHKVTGTKFDELGFNDIGFDEDGSHKDGIMYDKND